MNKVLTKHALTIAIAGSLCVNAWAIEPQDIRLTDGIIFTPALKASESYDYNFRAVSNKTKESS